MGHLGMGVMISMLGGNAKSVEAFTGAMGKTIAALTLGEDDALHFVLKEKLAGDEDHKSIVLITDGDDKASRVTPQEVIELAQRNNVAIYAISDKLRNFEARRDYYVLLYDVSLA